MSVSADDIWEAFDNVFSKTLEALYDARMERIADKAAEYRKKRGIEASANYKYFAYLKFDAEVAAFEKKVQNHITRVANRISGFRRDSY